MPASGNGRFSRIGVPELQERLKDVDACLVGPGMGQCYDTEEVVYGILEEAKCPVVLDADGINVLAGHIDRLDKVSVPVVLTPHAGEFRRIGGDPAKNRMDAAREMAERTGAVIVLKGYRTVVAGPNGEIYVNSTGNPGMATGAAAMCSPAFLPAFWGREWSRYKRRQRRCGCMAPRGTDALHGWESAACCLRI